MIQICRAEDGEAFQVGPSWMSDGFADLVGRRLRPFGTLKGTATRNCALVLAERLSDLEALRHFCIERSGLKRTRHLHIFRTGGD